MKKTEIIKGLYYYLIQNLPDGVLDLIIRNDVRVENYFTVNFAVYLDVLLKQGKILSYSLQRTLKLPGKKRKHIDILFTDLNNVTTYIELKHFAISLNRGETRDLKFYTSNSAKGKSVGIVGDCEKMEDLRNKLHIEENANLVCCAFITPKPTQNDFTQMKSRFAGYVELIDWDLKLPISLSEQNAELGIMTLEFAP